jgi:hypothetical protein
VSTQYRAQVRFTVALEIEDELVFDAPEFGLDEVQESVGWMMSEGLKKYFYDRDIADQLDDYTVVAYEQLGDVEEEDFL